MVGHMTWENFWGSQWFCVRSWSSSNRSASLPVCSAASCHGRRRVLYLRPSRFLFVIRKPPPLPQVIISTWTEMWRLRTCGGFTDRFLKRLRDQLRFTCSDGSKVLTRHKMTFSGSHVSKITTVNGSDVLKVPTCQMFSCFKHRPIIYSTFSPLYTQKL